jgi:hypothetical protein
MAPTNGTESESSSDPIGTREQDARVAYGRATPDSPARPGLTLVGFLGDSHREGYRRLYLDDGLTVFVEFNVEFVVYDNQLPAGQSPFLGEPATSVTFQLDAELEFEHTRTYTSEEWQLDPPIAPSGGCPPCQNSDNCVMYRWSRGYCYKSGAC